MATTIPYKDKDGNIVSYQIQVFRGRDSSGKKLKPYTTSWKVPVTYKSEKSIQKALEKAVGEFETECRKGNISVEQITLSEYCRHYIKLKGTTKKKSIAFYNSLLPRIDNAVGYKKLNKLTAKDLDEFYLLLQQEGVRKDAKAVADDVLSAEINKKRLTITHLSTLSGLSAATVSNAIKHKHINILSAEKLANALNMKFGDLFTSVASSDAKGLSAKSIGHYHTFIHAVLQMAYKKGDVHANVVDRATPPTIPPREAEFFEIEEIIEIRKALDKYPMKYKVMICLLVDTGIRRGELFGIRWNSINFEKRQILIDRNVQWVKGEGLFADTPKGKKSRIVSISDEMTKLLKTYKKEQNKIKLMIREPDYNKEGYLFIQDNGNVMYPSGLNHWTKKFEAAENLPHIYPHKFRHSQASILFAAGIDSITVSGRLGHAQNSTTANIYGHVMNNADKRASDAIANAIYNKNHA